MFKLTPYTTTLGLSGLSLNFAVATIATCAFWLFGYDMSVMVSAISAFHCQPSRFTDTLRAVLSPRARSPQSFPK